MGCHEAASARYGPVRRDSYIRYEVTERLEPAAGHARAKGTAGGSRKQECPDRVVHRSHSFALTPATINPPSFPVKADEP